MPIYEYRCDACKKEFEVLTLGMNDKGITTCPQCKSRKTRKMMSSFGRGKYASLLKGGGDYSGAGASGGSGCSSCSSSNCSSCGH